MEEDLKTVEELINGYKAHIKNYEESDCKTNVYQHLVKECQSLENLLKAYKDLEEENIHWRGQYHLLSRKINVVPVSKIKEKIEELENLKLCSDKFYQLITEDKIKLLQELLEEE